MSETLFEKLRAATYDQHEALHEVVDIDAMTVSAEQYAVAMRGYRTAVKPLEDGSHGYLQRQSNDSADSLCNSIEGIGWIHRLRKTDWLNEDIAALPPSPSADDPGEAQSIRTPPRILDWATFLGCNYVTEGMTLGAMSIAPIIRHRLPQHGDCVRFFSGYGDQTGRHWNHFKKWGNEIRCDWSVACQTARETFDWFRECLSRR